MDRLRPIAAPRPNISYYVIMNADHLLSFPKQKHMDWDSNYLEQQEARVRRILPRHDLPALPGTWPCRMGVRSGRRRVPPESGTWRFARCELWREAEQALYSRRELRACGNRMGAACRTLP